MALSSGGLIPGSLYAGQRKASGKTDVIRQNENLHLKKRIKYIALFVYLLLKENLYLKSYLSGPKSRNQRVHTSGLLRWGLI